MNNEALTIMYLTDNTVEPSVAAVAQRELIKAAAGKRIVSVSQKPLAFGDNVCVGEIGRSWMSLYTQMIAGLNVITTPYVAIAEHDVLYTPEHYSFTPPTDWIFYYNHNCWLVQWGPAHPELNGMYSYWPKRFALSQLICNKELLRISTLEIMELLNSGLKVTKGMHWHGEPGLTSKELRDYVKAYQSSIGGNPDQLQRYLRDYVTKYKSESFETQNPNLDIRYGGNFTGPKRGKLRRYELPYWGEFKKVME